MRQEIRTSTLLEGKGYFFPGYQSLAFKVIKDKKHHVARSKDANTDNSYKIGLSATLIAWFGDDIPESPKDHGRTILIGVRALDLDPVSTIVVPVASV